MQQANTTVIEQERPAEDLAPEAPVCRHHWRIESPNGAISVGRCKRCGEVRDFQNSSTDSIWENDSDSGNRWRGRGRNNAAVADVPASAEAPAPISESALGRLLGTGFRGRME